MHNVQNFECLLLWWQLARGTRYGRTYRADTTSDDAVERESLRDAMRHATAAGADRLMDRELLVLARH